MYSKAKKKKKKKKKKNDKTIAEKKGKERKNSEEKNASTNHQAGRPTHPDYDERINNFKNSRVSRVE